MANETNLLKAATYERLSEGEHKDGGGLFLIVGKTGARRWEVRFSFAGSPVVGDSAQRAYRRSDALGERRQLLKDWADYLRGEMSPGLVFIEADSWVRLDNEAA